MSEPTPAAWQAVERIGRYLIGARRIVQTFKWCEVSSHVEGFGDCDRAGDKVSRRSTSGGALNSEWRCPQDMVSSTEDNRTL